MNNKLSPNVQHVFTDPPLDLNFIRNPMIGKMTYLETPITFN
jgi:hypothetical protein